MPRSGESQPIPDLTEARVDIPYSERAMNMAVMAYFGWVGDGDVDWSWAL